MIGADTVIYSAVIKEDNQEYQKAKELKISLLSRERRCVKFILKDKRV